MRCAKTPRLDDSLAGHKLDLSTLHATTEDREGIAFAIRDLGRQPSCNAEQAATGEHLEHLLRRCSNERFLVDGHLTHLPSALRRARSAGLPNGLPCPTSR